MRGVRLEGAASQGQKTVGSDRSVKEFTAVMRYLGVDPVDVACHQPHVPHRSLAVEREARREINRRGDLNEL